MSKSIPQRRPTLITFLRLIKELSFKGEMDDEMITTMEELNSYYIESRYTEDIVELSKFLTEAKAVSIINSIKELFGWIKARI
jgi:HEPN domain-containing protein